MSSDDAKRALLSQVVGREVVREVAPILATAGIPVMPLKGVWLQACVYGPAEGRIITDVDLLVPEDRFAPALHALLDRGWRRGPGNVSEISLYHPAFELPVDLHRRLFSRGAFNLATHSLFARAHLDRVCFGVPLQMPDPLDVFAHLVGHFVKSRTQPDDRMRLTDFVAIADRCKIDPMECARHLQRVGMGRAARYALSELARRNDAFSVSLLAALPRDRIGEQATSLARLIARRSSPASTLGALPGFFLEPSLGAGVRALVLRMLNRGREPQP